MKRLILTLAFCIGFGHTLIQAQDSKTPNVTGTWKGKNYADKVGEPAEVELTLKQSGTKVTGTYKMSTGVSGPGVGDISGDRMTIVWTNTQGCPGHYENDYYLEEGMMYWKFTGVDCLGREEGLGYAKKVAD